VKLRDLERHLTARGARKVREGGKHTKWRSADGARPRAVPRHTEIGPAASAAADPAEPFKPSQSRHDRVTIHEVRSSGCDDSLVPAV
jgi:hypothetical protein